MLTARSRTLRSRKQMAMEASAPKVPYQPGVPTPKPRWIIRDKNGFAPGINILRRLLRPRRPPCPIDGPGVQAVSGDGPAEPRPRHSRPDLHLLIYYLEGYVESAYAVAIADAPATIDISTEVARSMRLPSISQVRICRGSTGTLAFTQHQPITAVFEFGMINDGRFPKFERGLDEAFGNLGSATRCTGRRTPGSHRHSSAYMYGAQRIASWKAARNTVLGNDQALMRLFEPDAMMEAGLADRSP